MRTLLVLVSVPMLLSACGPGEGEFLPQYNTALCQHIMACSSEAELTFDGVLDQETCEAVHAEEVQLWGAGCRFVGTAADACLLDVQALKCPAAKGTLSALPKSCELVYRDCEIGSTDKSSTDKPAKDTDVADDTDTATP